MLETSFYGPIRPLVNITGGQNQKKLPECGPNIVFFGLFIKICQSLCKVSLIKVFHSDKICLTIHSTRSYKVMVTYININQEWPRVQWPHCQQGVQVYLRQQHHLFNLQRHFRLSKNNAPSGYLLGGVERSRNIFWLWKIFISENSALILMDPNKKAENRGHMLALFSTSAPLMLTNGLIGP